MSEGGQGRNGEQSTSVVVNELMVTSCLVLSERVLIPEENQ